MRRVVLVLAGPEDDLAGLELPAKAHRLAAFPSPGASRRPALTDPAAAPGVVRRELAATPEADVVVLLEDPEVLAALARDLTLDPGADPAAGLSRPGALTIGLPTPPPPSVLPLPLLLAVMAVVVVAELAFSEEVHRSGIAVVIAAVIGLLLLPARRTRVWGWGVLAAAGLALAAVSVGMYQGEAICDLEYIEDSAAETDMNVVMTEDGRIIEVQGTAEAEPFTHEELLAMLALAKGGIADIIALQKQSLS